MVLPESMRLKGYRCFDHLHRSGTRYHGSLMVLRVAKARPQLLSNSPKKESAQPCRCAVTISNKVSKRAVVRNRLRRLLHDHLSERLASKTDLSNSWALLSLKPHSSEVETNPLLEECDRLLRNAGFLL